ncbi:hypothetical protein HG576_04895 [Helicobacter pylori]|uniref:hypothetical protein n=1 Tax=Helicobacter pylori TaxID=210 RepID=UPI0019233E67|nr:hypothetical protein [Helicobacter pylori]QQW76578.1 hypothetical protein HG576_04895 [Helicobacter pylori]
MAFNHSTIQPFNHSTIQPFNQAIKQSSNQAIKQSSNQAIKQRYHTFITIYPFYKRSLKNPLLFIILSFIPSFILSCINPHRIFQPFDSISPIFNQWGLQS